MVASSGDAARAPLARLLRAIEGECARTGAALLAAVDPGPGPGRDALRAAGYMASPESYLLLEATRLAQKGTSLAGAGERWRFEFLDHDAL